MFKYKKHNKHKKTQKGREKKAERLGTQDLWNNILVSSLGFPFASSILHNLELMKLATPKHQ